MSFIDELKRLNEAATEAPWFDDGGKVGAGDRGVGEMDSDADAALIGLLRNKAPAIIALVQAAKRCVENAALFCDEEIELEQALAALEDGNG